MFYLVIWCCVVLSFTSVNVDGNYLQFNSPEVFAKIIEQNTKTVKVSEDCKYELNEYREGIRNGKLWALQMFDATGKIPSGLFTGHMGDLGDFNQCLEIKGNFRKRPIYGKYCQGYVNLLSLLPSSFANLSDTTTNDKQMMLPPLPTGICSPSACTALELQEFYESVGVNVIFDEQNCQSKFTEQKLEAKDIAAITFLTIILCIMVLCTTYDVVLHYNQQKPIHIAMVSFSVFTNTKKLLTLNKSPSQISCLHGIRTLSLLWIILGHRYSIYQAINITNRVDLIEWLDRTSSMFLLGAHVVVDTFLLLSGLVISYVFMGSAAKGQRFNIPLYYLHRYIRLTPALAAEVLIFVTLLRFMGSGPYWPWVIDGLIAPCENYWWSTLLYIQNYVNPAELCITPTHYLSVDTQLFLLSPILLISLRKKPKLTIYFSVFLLFLSILSPLLIAWFYKLRSVETIGGFVLQNEDFIKYFYYATHARAASWLIGFILGYIIYKTRLSGIKRITKHIWFPFINIILWCVSLGVMAACVFSWHHLTKGEYDRVGNTLVIGLIRPSWSVALSWIIFSCVHGYGGPVNWFLSLPFCEVISKLSYSMYLLHIIPIAVSLLGTKEAIRFDHFRIIDEFWGNTINTFFLSLLWVLAFESPIIALEKIIFGGETTKHKPSEKREVKDIA